MKTEENRSKYWKLLFKKLIFERKDDQSTNQKVVCVDRKELEV
jgi:hypothetical protein